LIVVAGLPVACLPPPRINRLTVAPAEVCPNDPVDVNWSADGQAVQLRQDPPMSLADPGRDSREGVQGVAGDKDFDVVLEARGKGAPEIAQRRYVHVVTESWTFVLTGPVVCDGNRVKVEVDFHVADPQIDARMQVMTAVPRTDRALTVEHAGLPAITMPPGATTAFRGTPMGGQWTLTTSLKKGESCAAGASKPPPEPALIVSGTCSGLPRVVQRGSTSADSAPRCGHFGQTCCDGSRCEGRYQCDEAKTCRDPSRPSAITAGQRCNRRPATALSRTYFVGIRDGNKCGQVLPQLADSVEEANACARAAMGASPMVVDGRLGQFDFCKNRRTQLFVPAFSEQEAAECARRTWPRARVVPGLCEQ
jgi:hypothetical protein